MVESHLFNVVGQLSWIKDQIVNNGPVALETGADWLVKIAEVMKTSAGYIRLIGPTVQFQMSPKGGDFPKDIVLSAEAADHLNKLQALKADFEKVITDADKEIPQVHAQMQKAQEFKIQAGIMDLFGRISPEMRKYIAGIAIQIINGFLAKSGIPITLPTPAVPAGTTKKETK